ncbi:MAG: class I SAM-dependent methyltransferase [Candidatus Peregrinibacteria bacterium]|nr:class I SAM-dependent methyltransferase [Candidatus Peregrinibacteria bacterium]MDZ4245258.1 class I SAM-dependent methyltransferase [Candidatus Gracilibacteria bacterium]
MLNILSKIIIRKVRRDYDAIADNFSETRQAPWESWKLFKKYFGKQKDILDIGCGNGRAAEFFEYKSYTGIDISKNLIEIAKKEHSKNKNSKNIHFKIGNFTSIPSSSKFDTIISIAVLHHLPSNKLRSQAIKEVSKTLKKDGIFIFSVWNLLYNSKYTAPRKKALLLSIFTFGLMHPRDLFIPWKKGLNKRNRYYYAFKEKEVTALLSNQNFEIIDVIHEKNGKKVPEKDSLNIYFVCKKMI